MSEKNCPGYRGEWFGWWGKCQHLVVYGIGGLLESGSREYLCGKKLPGEGCDVACPTKGRRP